MDDSSENEEILASSSCSSWIRDFREEKAKEPGNGLDLLGQDIMLGTANAPAKYDNFDVMADDDDALVWSNDAEKAYFAYMLQQEKERRALKGKDEEDSLVGASTIGEMQGQGRIDGASSCGEPANAAMYSLATSLTEQPRSIPINAGDMRRLPQAEQDSSRYRKEENPPHVVYLSSC
jgi:hypothetical protein